MNHQTAEELLGAYAIDALEHDEAQQLQEHVDSCPKCVEELSQHREVVGSLASFGTDAPGHLWETISEKIAPLPRIKTSPPRLGSRYRTKRSMMASLLYPIAAVLIVVLALEVIQLNHRVNTLSANRAATMSVKEAMATPGAHQVALKEVGGKDSAELVFLPNGEAVFGDDQLPHLAPTSTYQLWGITNDKAVSVALLGSNPKDQSFSFGNQLAPIYAVTVEKAGGSTSPTTTPILET